MEKIAIVPGSFDPVTAGHTDIIRRAARLFDRVFAVVMNNPNKNYLLGAEARLALLHDAVKSIENVTAEYSPGYLFEYARDKGACAIVKGARTGVDFEYEVCMADFNYRHFPGADTLVLCADSNLAHVSSSTVREMALRGESLTGLVTPICEQALKDALSLG